MSGYFSHPYNRKDCEYFKEHLIHGAEGEHFEGEEHGAEGEHFEGCNDIYNII